MSNYAQFAEHSSDDRNYASADEFQSPLFLKRLHDWMRWTKIFGWMLIAVGGLSLAQAVLRLLSTLADIVPPGGPRGALIVAMAVVLSALATRSIVDSTSVLASLTHATAEPPAISATSTETPAAVTLPG